MGATEPSGEPPEPPQPTQTTKYSQTGGGGYNPQIQGDTRVYGGGRINMGGEGMGLPGKILILGLFGIVCAYLYLAVQRDARFSWNPSGEPPEPPQPTQTTVYSQTGAGGYNPQIQGDTRVYGGGHINMGYDSDGGGMGLPRKILILGLFGIVCAYLYLAVRTDAQPTQTTKYSQTGGGGYNPQIQGDTRVYGGGHINMGGGGMGLPGKILILGLFGIICACLFLAVRTDAQFTESSGEPPEPPQPTRTTKYSQTGGGGYNPQIQGDNTVSGGGHINMGGGEMGLPGKILILGLFGIACACLYLAVRTDVQFSWNPFGEPPQPPQPTVKCSPKLVRRRRLQSSNPRS